MTAAILCAFGFFTGCFYAEWIRQTERERWLTSLSADIERILELLELLDAARREGRR
jgi:hypothetical protein